jgi:hypothetical protein
MSRIMMTGLSLALVIALNVSGVFADNSFTFTSARLAQAIPSDSGAFFYSYLKNTGDNDDTYTVIKIDNIPDGWFSVFCVDSLCLWDSTDVTIAAGDSASVRPEVFPQGISGDGESIIRVTSRNDPQDIKELEFRIVTGHTTLVINMGSVENEFRAFFDTALTIQGISYNYWDGTFTTFLDVDLMHFDNLLIYSGDKLNDILNENQISTLESFLLNGGNLLITGQGLASSLAGTGFLNNYLGVSFLSEYSGQLIVEGVSGDPIGSGFQFLIEGGEGADNQVEPDIVLPVNSVVVFEYDSGQPAGVRFSGSAYKSVFLPFGLEAVADNNVRGEIINAVLFWLEEPTSVYDLENNVIPRNFIALNNYPNPFNARTLIEINNTNREIEITDAFIGIYDVGGRRIANIRLDDKMNYVEWNGRDRQGKEVASGVYFYRLESLNVSSGFRKMTLIK